jgi:hypothetical protein
MRGIAAVCFVLAAFAWVPPFIDRAGLVALGLAVAALAIPAGASSGLPWRDRARGPALFDGLPLDEAAGADLMRRAAMLSDRDGPAES